MSKHPISADSGAILDLLLARHIDFILVGGVAAISHGSTSNTHDVDIVHSRDPINVEKIGGVLTELDAFFRTDLSGRRIVPGKDHLQGHGQLLLTTRHGPLDLLCQLHDGRGYDELLPHSMVMDLSGQSLRLLDIPTLIEVKSAAGRTKDILVVAELLALMDRQIRG